MLNYNELCASLCQPVHKGANVELSKTDYHSERKNYACDFYEYNKENKMVHGNEKLRKICQSKCMYDGKH